MIVLALQLNGKVIREYRFQEGKTVRIGRRSDNEVVIDNLAVSGRHAQIEMKGEAIVLEDNESTNGIYVNEDKVSSAQLQNGDVIKIGKHTLNFSIEEEQRQEAFHEGMDRTVVMDSDMFKEMIAKKASGGSSAKTGPPGETHGVLSVLAGGKGQIVLSKKLVKIGKDATSDIVVSGLLVSKTAATISKRSNGYYLSYVGGIAKPKINGKSVKKTVRLNETDIIQLGTVRMQLMYDKAS